MKRIGYLYEQMLNKKFISYCYNEAIRGKRKRRDVKKLNKDDCVNKIYEMIKNENFVPSKPYNKIIEDHSSHKERVISVVPFFPDGVIQTMCVEVLKPILLKNMYPWSCASVPNRGILKVIKRTKILLKNKKNTKYCLKIDIRHYYPSVNHDILMQKLEHKIKDKKFLNFIRMIIDSYNEVGLPIGYYLSQWLSNFFLEDIDWFIHHDKRTKGHIRYMDDITIYGSNKRKLRKFLLDLNEKIKENDLELKSNYQIFPTNVRGVDFVGYRFYHDHITLRRRNSLRLMRICRAARKGRTNVGFARCYLSRISQLDYCDNVKFIKKYVDKGMKKKMRIIVSKHDRNKNKRNNKNKRKNNYSNNNPKQDNNIKNNNIKNKNTK